MLLKIPPFIFTLVSRYSPVPAERVFHALLLLPQCLRSYSLQHLAVWVAEQMDKPGKVGITLCVHTHIYAHCYQSNAVQLFIPYMANHL